MTTPSTTVPAIQIDRVSKTYGATKALQDVSVSILPGQVHGLIGRNGAGKSTLLRMITGLETPDTGAVRFFGEDAPPAADAKAWQQRVACVYQRPSVFTNLTIAENLFAGRLPGNGPSVSWRTMQNEAERILAEWRIDLDPRSLLSDAPIEERQMLTIAKALDAGTRIVLLDEPTVQLEGSAIRRLFDKVQELQQDGVTFVFVSHFLREVTAICDSASVLRDGKLLWSRTGDDVKSDDLVEALLAGQEQRRHRVESAAATATDTAPALELRSATEKGGAFTDVSFRVAPGELVAIGGVGGSGKYSVGEAIAGLRRLGSGSVLADGEVIPTGKVKASQKAGVGFVPADRHKDGYVPQLSVAENMTMGVMDRLAPAGFFSPRKQNEMSRTLIQDVALVPPNPALAVSGLSGGNQQKVVLARALARDPRVLVLISPTAGVDIAAKDAIYALILRALADGVAVVLISDDVEELLVSSRVLIMREGRIAAELAEPTEEDIVRAIEGLE
ncbi:sugar ABC transporter ATP-binding protein [Schumannella luteola]|uniref:Simple sugar transport system ATP-binding protein n=1 Tax=Schumannella luteola TaxID=472059 RepID=A0A852Y7Y0_9MICO|nr:sugar ABC transporter ATP-binding protein [Schumannella luteola]NYG97490.1 simple sugar transport system ATP-binding protein [Schumannella luteola]TPX05906.1 sugar ABC transporter ATP-binding protein [Schumannella luteola]